MGLLGVPSDRSSRQWATWVTGRFEWMAALWNAGDRTEWLSLYSPSLWGELPANGSTREAPGVAERDWDGAHQPDKTWSQQVVNAVHVGGDEAAVECRYGGVVNGVEQWASTVELWHLDADGLFDRYRTFLDVGSSRQGQAELLVSQWCAAWNLPSIDLVSSIVTEDYWAEDPVGGNHIETLAAGWERFARAGVGIDMSCRGLHVCGDEIAGKMRLVAAPRGAKFTRNYVTVFRLSADARFRSQRTFG